tara:strand:- start:82 stop:492 length:411 start_codon:yes stop_codon:yes gene_type:complete
MSYTIEFSLNIQKRKDVTNYQDIIINKAKELRCDNIYIDYEFEGKNRTIKRNHCIFTAIFNEDNQDMLIKFIRFIKKERYIYIECLYDENVTNQLMYASIVYQRKMQQDYVNKYKINQASLNKSEMDIVKAITTKC